ncbi:MAG: primosomal protein N' [Oscillospiraceae bacterium]|nr:primosomal protein N' [Oscillospiraceae bacterium]
MYKTVEIAVEKTAFHFDRLFSYLVPSALCNDVFPGKRVLVPFGGANSHRQGMIFSVSETEDVTGYKSILSVLDKEPVLGKAQLNLAVYITENTYCTYYEAVKAMLPPGIGYEIHFKYELAENYAAKAAGNEAALRVTEYLESKNGEDTAENIKKLCGVDDVLLRSFAADGILTVSEQTDRRIGDKTCLMAELSPHSEDIIGTVKLTAKQQAVVDFLTDNSCASVKEIEYFTGSTRAVCDGLVKRGIIRYNADAVYRRPYESCDQTEDASAIELTSEQQKAYDGLCEQYDSGKRGGALLFGVTGSGKTRVYLKLIQHVIDSGEDVIVMVPEISLTPQTMRHFRSYFGDTTAIIHSGLSMGERLDEWKRINERKARIVIGTRSAVFAPVKKLGMIIMDEEQEHTYKSDSAPRYHAKDAARFRCAGEGAMLLLASATPSIESYYNAKNGKYSLYTLKQRYGGAVLPSVNVVDMKIELLDGNVDVMSALLSEEIEYNLSVGEQSILLINRRGYNTVVKCAQCGSVASCPNCSIALTYHRANERLMCHYCGYSVPAQGTCPECGSKFVRYDGAGTQKLEEELQKRFSGARVLRMDADTTMSKLSYEKAFKSFADGEYDIMLGTQMIAKGLDFPNVTLVGVLSADSALFGDDFRSYEKTFSLVTQVVGRCGRADKKGRAFIQTYSPENPVIEFASHQNYEAFYEYELANRKIMLYPPFCDICAIGFTGERESAVVDCARAFIAELKKQASALEKMPLRVIGPTPSAVVKVGNKYRYKVIIKCVNNKRFKELLKSVLLNTNPPRGVSVYADSSFSGML